MWSRIKSFFQGSIRRGKTLQISTKITCMYALILFFVLCMMSLVTGLGVYFSFYHQAEREMEFSIHRVMESIQNGTAFTPEFWRGDPVVPGVVLRVTDMTGQVIMENEAHYPSISEIERNTVKPPIWANPSMEVSNLHNMSIYHAKVDVVYQGEMLQLHFFRTITSEKNFLAILQWFLLLTTIVSFLLALLAGFFLSKRILRPIRTMTHTVRKIEVENLDRRIHVPNTHDELYELAETFNHMLDRVEIGFKQQQRFVSDASHELRTPVTVILGYSDLLSRWGSKDEEVLHEGISSIRSEAEDMQQLIEKLLFLARADQKRQVLHKENLEFSELVEDITRKLRLVEKGKHEVELRENDEGEVYADQVSMRQLLRIFLDNGRKYTPEGGHLWVSSTRTPDGGHLRVEIGDDGIGIAKEDQKKIFERFYRVDTSRTKAEGVSGTGLGLSIAVWIAEQHDIHIDVESDIGKGTKFILTVPLVAGSEKEGRGVPAEEDAGEGENPGRPAEENTEEREEGDSKA